MNPSAIEGHLTLVLIQWMIIIAAAFVFGRLGKKFGQPLAVGEIAAGIILGPSVFGATCNWLALQFNTPDLGDLPATIFPKSTQTSMQLLGKLGLIFLLFQVGMEFDYSHLRSKSGRRPAQSDQFQAGAVKLPSEIGVVLMPSPVSRSWLAALQLLVLVR